jgi:hypothetical protein
MGTRQKGRFWRTARIYFRRFRITVWLLILILFGGLIYLNQIGLPDFVKTPLLDNLRARGLDLRFSRLRLSWYHGIVAENARFGQADEPLSPHLTLAEVRLRFNHAALARLQFQVDSLILRQGRLVWPIAETNQAPRQLSVENIQTELRFLPGDEWALDHFTASFAGARIQLSGTVTNASAFRERKLLQAEQPTPVHVWQNRLRAVADTLERIRFRDPPELRLNVRGDARDLGSFGVRLFLSTPGADTPWGSVAKGHFSARLFPATTNGLSSAEASLEADQAQTRWATTANLQLTAHVASFEGQTNMGNGEVSICASRVETEWGTATNVQVTLHVASVPGQTNLVNADLAFLAGSVETKWGGATNALINAQWLHTLTNAIPLTGQGELRCSQANTPWATARELRLNARLDSSGLPVPPEAEGSWAWWATLAPHALSWDCHVSGLRHAGVEAEEVTCDGDWRAPQLTVTNLHATIYQRQLDARADLDVATRALRLNLASDVDPHKLSPLLPEEARRSLASCAWATPPELKADVALILPAWTNRHPDWRVEVQPTLQLRAELKLEHGASYRDVACTAAQSHILYSNMVWRLPDLMIARPEGGLEALVDSNDRTRDFHCRIGSTLDLRVLRPLMEPGVQKALDLITFTEPPVIDAEIWGRWHDAERTGFKGRLALTNFTFRGESASGLQTALQYTNRFLQVTSPRLQRGAQRLSADSLGVDLPAQKIYLTNGFSTVPPMVVARAIGPHIVRAVEAYRFVEPPTAYVHGTIPLHGEEDADLHFDLKGGPFEWWRFHVPEIQGHVHWLGEHLTLSDVQLGFYGGQANGSAHFDFHSGLPTDYRFNLTATNALLHPLVADLFLNTNRLDGKLSGTLVITNASTAAIQSWYGYGDLSLRDGLIWDIPIFGVLSGVLNSMVPGLGSSRANAGTCSYIITNGIIRSEDMDIRSTGTRLQYRGTVDFQGQVNARVEASILRDMPLFGPVVSTVLWPVTKLFEYKVGGTLNEPKLDPVYVVPKVIFLPFQFPFHPFRTLRSLFPEDSASNRTNAPALNSPKQN